ncbi:type III-B CRISPR module RAMP protein Cmr1 [Desulfobacter hydrogenophilus]|uniref:Type III-B CRISPR module RAMP protein Cmr1 n=1 Tax=Desulfobacter hydrogenophilus TaxID=2291 RepID=A0A328FHE6_9BACT|nr:type III-B CRISPR module RAMP protein Cmr1 [Desulfobacter hydrogenophilus]NDY71660.1 type III-B CRISPR module RAMP protein Cmr1 [Desulfobacter hydrogenophilus]QBH13174.1 type III-B CRISPR module RAMP protein Cmr1 [Desulfobacter hydrogenophilus]RAM02405.1 type III-B CRISPR module RAMP protein Cmr1 [Desulfobacter hydrogenophilus]
MARKLTTDESIIDPDFTMSRDRFIKHEYELELLTPMAGGGTKSWVPDFENPVRTQSIKGQLRFWWRTMQNEVNSAEFKTREDSLWGSTQEASTVRLSVNLTRKPTIKRIPWGGNNDKYLQYDNAQVPGYVLFPFQNTFNPGDDCDLIGDLNFIFKVTCFREHETEVCNSIKLWILFGGLGARTRRGCGSLYCKGIAEQFQTTGDIDQFVKNLTENQKENLSTSPYPRLSGARFKAITTDNNDAAKEWCAYLNRYGAFRQKPGIGRRPGGNRPGRSYWPEPDAIRLITGQHDSNHDPIHPADKWFPRGAYGLPILTEFKSGSGDPAGKYTLLPAGETQERWPSPVILKVTKLGDGNIARLCLILNDKGPQALQLEGPAKGTYTLAPGERPLDYTDKEMLENTNILQSKENPYDGLLRYLKMTKVA